MSGTLALVGGGEWTAAARALDVELLGVSGGTDVVVLPTAAAFEDPDAVVEQARAWFAGLDAHIAAARVLTRADASDPTHVDAVRRSRFVYLADGSPLHLRSVLKDTELFAALLDVLAAGGVVAASGAGATVLGDPMVDPRGGAYTVGLGVAPGLAVFPYHGTAAVHLRERSVDLLAPDAVLAGVDEATALVRGPDGAWRVAGARSVTLYARGSAPRTVEAGGPVDLSPR